MGEFVMAIDQGTTGTTVALFDSMGKMQAKVNTEYRQIYPQPGWVEHDLEDIWSSVTASIQEALRQARVAGSAIRASGITNQRETTGVWERNGGKPLHHAIVWQCRRTAPMCHALKDAGHEPLFRERTGLVLDAYFSGTKLRWLLDNVSGMRERADQGALCFGTIDTFLVFRLTGGKAHVTDVSNASRTLMMNLKSLAWDDELLEILQIPRKILPEIRTSSEVYGVTQGIPGLPDGVPICGIAGDQQAALFGQACFQAGEVKCTYGTGAFVLMNTGAWPVQSQKGLLTSVGWKLGGEVVYVLEGSVFIAGAAVQWMRDSLGLFPTAAASEEMAASVASTGGVYLVPAFVGLGAPYWEPHARGALLGLSRGTTAAHLARAALESIAYQTRDLVEAMERDSGVPLRELRVDGGAAANSFLMQFQADVLAKPVVRPACTETTALGAAFLAGLATGVWKNTDELEALWKKDRVFEPAMPASEREQLYAGWKQAVERVLR